MASVMAREHPGLTERAALGGIESLPLGIGLLDERRGVRRVGRGAGLLAHEVVVGDVIVSCAVRAPRVVDRRQPVAQRLGKHPMAVHDGGILDAPG